MAAPVDTSAPNVVWSPLAIVDVQRLLAPARWPWWIAGGVAIDLFLGRTTRTHTDVDVQILRGTEQAIARHLPGWELFTASAGALHPWRDGDDANAIWCRPHAGAPWALELLVADVIDGYWIYRRDRRISRPLAELGDATPAGLPYVRPEITLLYKSNRIRPKDEADFSAALPALDTRARRWLAEALAVIDTEHVWLPRLR